MAIAVIKTGGKQYKVQEGQELLVERIPDKKEKDKIEFKDLLYGKKVFATILGEEKGEKIHIFKFRPRKRYRRKTGHRQIYTRIRIDKIGSGETKK
uniref:Large ribosomal subunit protein bL21 n=1 Tax=candidate division CPR3 bacterium TaxID=2268181 RepID=A0A7V3J962_UNCC3